MLVLIEIWLVPGSRTSDFFTPVMVFGMTMLGEPPTYGLRGGHANH